MGVQLYLLCASVPFSHERLVRGEDGRFRIVDRSRRVWDETVPVVVEAETEEDGWTPIQGDVDMLGGTVSLPGWVNNGAVVRASGRFHPLAEVGAADGWRLAISQLGGIGVLGGHAPARGKGGASVTLLGCQIDPYYRDELKGRRLLVVLVSDRRGRSQELLTVMDGPAADTRGDVQLAVHAFAT